MEDLRKFGQRVFHDPSVKGLLGVIDCGCRVKEEALQVGVDHGLDRILAKLVDKKGTKTRGGGEKGGGGGRYVKTKIHS